MDTRSSGLGDRVFCALLTAEVADQATWLGQPVAGQGIDAGAIRAAVDLFYERVIADPSLAPVFSDADMPRLKAHQRAFLLQALGGPSLYSGRDMQTAHAGLHITDDQFARTLAHLVASLREVGVAPDVVQRATVDVQGLRALIVEH
jgi:hemoglobin